MHDLINDLYNIRRKVLLTLSQRGPVRDFNSRVRYRINPETLRELKRQPLNDLIAIGFLHPLRSDEELQEIMGLKYIMDESVQRFELEEIR